MYHVYDVSSISKIDFRQISSQVKSSQVAERRPNTSDPQDVGLLACHLDCLPQMVMFSQVTDVTAIMMVNQCIEDNFLVAL